MAAPATQEGARNRGLGGEDGDGDRALRRRLVVGPLCNDVVTVEALVLDALVAQELREALRCGDGAALAAWSTQA